MADYSISAIHGIRAFLWDELVDNNIMDPNRYANNWIPIVPTHQVPEFLEMVDRGDNQGDVPFIVYNWVSDQNTQDWFIETDQCVFMIYSQNESEIRKIVAFMTDVFKRYDTSAEEINNYIQTEHSGTELAKFEYKYTSVSSSGGPLPSDQEDGRENAMVSIKVTYTTRLQASGRRA